MPREKTYRAWSCTINNYTNDDIENFKNILDKKQKNKLVFGKEIGENNTPHLQGACIIENKISFTALQKKLPKWHLEVKYKKATLKQLFSYCLKGTSTIKDGWTYEKTGPDYDGWHFGEFPTNQGERTDIDEMKECNTMKEAFETGHNLQCINYFEKYLKYHETPRVGIPKTFWYYGDTGTGKSKLAYKFAKNWGKYYVKADASKWWDGYDGEQIIIIDDYDPNTWAISFNDLLHLTYRGECRVETKGGTRQFKGLRIFITCAKEIKHTFNLTKISGEVKQLERRCEQFYFPK